MNQEQIKMLIDAFAASDLSMLEFSENGCTLRLARRGAALPASDGAASMPAVAVSAPLPTTNEAGTAGAADIAAPPVSAPAPAADVTAPLYGVVHLRPAPGEPDFVRAGEAVEAGRTLCVVEAMKVFNEVHAPRGATIASVLVESGQEVDAGQVLFRLG
ncbi:MAG TPA: acetyl-CoA carboxylase biotin carboxyl carrier protein subunit [Variovorax sp.]|nr:acetyl-CoA carboxylase biotin carboxyl carrier protein subunit [Variovorax sp.]